MKIFVIATLFAASIAFAADHKATATAGVKAGVPLGSIVRQLVRDGATEEQIKKIMADLKQDPEAVERSTKLWAGPGSPVSPS
jgi:hypothetical protein